MKYINQGTITALVPLIAGILVALFPSLGPEFKDEATGQLTGFLAAIVGLWGLVDEVIAAAKKPSVPDDDSDYITSAAWLAMPLLALVAIGCAPTQPERERYKTLTPVVEEYKTNHPTEVQTWTDFMRSWDISLSEREALNGGAK